MRRSIASLAPLTTLVLAATQTAVAAQTQTPATAPTMTVQSLMNDGYTVAGVFTSKVGWPGLFLQKGNTLLLCFVGEKPGSASVDTEYCKPVK